LVCGLTSRFKSFVAALAMFAATRRALFHLCD